MPPPVIGSKERRMRKTRGIPILFTLIFLMGLSLLLYPMVSNYLNSKRTQDVIQSYTQDMESVSQDDSQEWLSCAYAYNATLEGRGVPDAFALTTPEEDENYLSQLSFREDGVMGYIEIPKISVSLPIYHGTGEEVLSKGAGHLQGSALPVGGENTHCVISAHRGLPSAAMFTDLDQLEIGDHFYISVLNETLCYEVDQILVVEPEDTSALDVAEGMDLVTLVTCTPYGVNTQRLLVRGHRVPYTQKTMEQEAEMPVRSVYTNYALWIIGGLVITALFILGMLLFLRRRDRREAGSKEDSHET